MGVIRGENDAYAAAEGRSGNPHRHRALMISVDDFVVVVATMMMSEQSCEQQS